MPYQAAKQRYMQMTYRRTGRSGLLLPAISLGLWHNFGGVDTQTNAREMVLRAFDLGITHFDLANNYGPPPGSAEETFGKIMAQDLAPYRDELIISTKAGYYMWPGPYGEWGSRKYLIASLDQSLKRMGIPYVDIFYSHRPDPNTPLDETMMALDYAVRSGRALYAGISTYSAAQTREAARIMRELGTPILTHQPAFNIFNRWIEEQGLISACDEQGIGIIAFSPLAQGLLTNKYLRGVPKDSRAAKSHGFLQREQVSESRLSMVNRLNAIALERGQSLAQMAIAWVLRHPQMSSALVGASKVSQIEDNVGALANLNFSADELTAIEAILALDTEDPVW
ncbi:MAG: L-glyceraldehyde 3-phosphate reductase [Anaerolineales bacterium]|nr:L-glyceraldehyde 3-phosphate reductase [Anaerolineales bacterium]